MSYILDALRRADAERERGEVPGLQSQQHAVLDDDDDAAPRSRPLVWVVVALAVALAAAVAWNFLGGEPPKSPVPASLPPPVAAMPVTPILPTAVPPAVAPAPALASSPVAATAATMAVEPRKPAVRKVVAAPVTMAPASATPAASTARAAADSRVVPFAELPDAVRRDLPKLAFGGSSYSGSASSRMVILNGQVFHEGDTVAPGLTLRQIKPKAAVLSFRDVRFELSY